MGVVETTGEELLVGLDRSAEVDPAKAERWARAQDVLVLAVLALVQVGWVGGLAYAAFVFVSA